MRRQIPVGCGRVAPIFIIYAKWIKLGKRAGFARNPAIAAKADVLIACVSEDRTGGTEDTIRHFTKMYPERRLIIV